MRVSKKERGFIWNVETDFNSLKAEFMVTLHCENLANGKKNKGTIKQYFV